MSLLGELTYALISPGYRSIGTIIPDVVIEEAGRDELSITRHPIEGGGFIADHAFKQPVELEMRCGWSNSSAGYVGYTQDVYQALLALQTSRRPFSVSSGKRRYSNMLIRGLQVVTDAHSENTLMVAVSLHEVIIVSTSTTGTGTSTTAAGATADQASPETTGGTTDRGDQSGTAVGADSFAGSFNPGGFNTDGGTLPTPGFGLDGISPGPIGEVGPIQIDEIDGVPTGGINPEGVVVSPYNVFGS